ncbi:MAG: enoyl-CoA hydratase/isomerase family protein, partial [Bacteroidetes bacterium]|nr:enoyl-CoA hydratase/isomerase family protein [Bacteroidota bacterium]
DRAAKNTFSRQLIDGLHQVFNELQQNPTVKVVVIHGYDTYFCCGGTQEELMAIFSGKLTFTDLDFYRILLDCEVPVIAAMQGHAIGGGLAFACYADMLVLAEEAIYSTNFMKYGFTPGMGATYMIPYKFGSTIGHELLYSANTYHGGVLRDKGIPVPVVKKIEVIPKAMQLAQQLADKPQYSLKILKQHLTQEVRAKLPIIIEQELAMHRETFHQLEVRQRIEALFEVIAHPLRHK